MAVSKFKQKINQAKKLYNSGRYKTIADAVKAAYKKGKSVVSKKTLPKRVTVTRTVKESASVGRTCALSRATESALKSQLRNRMKDKLSSQLLRRELATTKREKRKIAKRVVETKRALRKLN